MSTRRFSYLDEFKLGMFAECIDRLSNSKHSADYIVGGVAQIPIQKNNLAERVSRR